MKLVFAAVLICLLVAMATATPQFYNKHVQRNVVRKLQDRSSSRSEADMADLMGFMWWCGRGCTTDFDECLPMEECGDQCDDIYEYFCSICEGETCGDCNNKRKTDENVEELARELLDLLEEN